MSQPDQHPSTRPLRSLRRFAAALFVALVAGGSCIIPSGPKDWVCTRDDSLSVTVGPGASPTISWTPECTASLLFVGDTLDAVSGAFWLLASMDAVSSQIPASVTYGTRPPNTTVQFAARSLEAGRTYTVFVTSRDNFLIGLTSFTR